MSASGIQLMSYKIYLRINEEFLLLSAGGGGGQSRGSKPYPIKSLAFGGQGFFAGVSRQFDEMVSKQRA